MDPTKSLNDNIQAAISTAILDFPNLPPHIDRDDLSQECWVAMLTAIRDKKFNPENPRAFHYICRLARNRIIDYLGKNPGDILLTSGDGIAAPDADDHAEDRERVLSAIKQIKDSDLTPEEQLILGYFYEDGLSVADAARRMSWSRQWFHRRRNELLQKLTTLLANRGIVSLQ